MPLLATALALTSLGATRATAAGDDSTVTDFAGLQTASSSCTGTSGDPTTITLGSDIAAVGEVSVGCHLVLDLAGFDLSVTNVVISPTKALTINDTGTDGTLTADASDADQPARHRQHWRHPHHQRRHRDREGGHYAAGIGGGAGSAGGTTIVNGGTVYATGGHRRGWYRRRAIR